MGFGGRRRCARAASTALIVAGLVLLSACSGHAPPPLSGEGDVPPQVKGPATDVDVCSLLPTTVASDALGAQLHVVGAEYGASRVPTYRCMIGDEFAVPQVTIELATGPIAANVFEDAYGDRAGGDPEYLKRLGHGAFLRNENDQRTLHIYVNGSVVSLKLQTDPANPIERKAIVGLAEGVLARLPTNPRLAPTKPHGDCSTVTPVIVGDAVGATPSLMSSLIASNGSLMCSWASRPGSATATVLHSADRVAAYRRNLDQSLYVEVKSLETTPSLTVLSRTDRAGDLVVFSHDEAMATITVIPSAGFAIGSIATTPGEEELANAIIAML